MSYDAELIERVLRAKEFRETSAETNLPLELSRTKSALCEGANWTIEKQSDGALILRLSRAADLIRDEETLLSYALPARK